MQSQRLEAESHKEPTLKINCINNNFYFPQGSSILTPAMKEVMMRKKKSAHVTSNAAGN